MIVGEGDSMGVYGAALADGPGVKGRGTVGVEGVGATGVSAAGEGGYARQLTDEERALQQQKLADHLKNIDVIVCTAAVPGPQS